jgi:hypothetical protein
MNTCSTCRWWTRACEWHDLAGFGGCKLTENSCGSLDHKQTKAFASNCFDYEHNILATKPDFGCNQWDGKDGE